GQMPARRFNERRTIGYDLHNVVVGIQQFRQLSGHRWVILSEHHTWSCHVGWSVLGQSGRRSRRTTRCYCVNETLRIGDSPLTGMWKLLRGPAEDPLRVDALGAPLLRDDALFDRESNQVGRAGQAEDVQEVGLVILDSPNREVELGGNFLHALALRQQAKYVALARREFAFARVGWGGQVPEHVSGNQRCQISPALCDGLNGVEQLVARGLLEQ